MEDTDKKRFAELMAGLAQTFITDISAQDLENYWRLLKGYPMSQIEQAIIGYCASPEGHRFMPKPEKSLPPSTARKANNPCWHG